MIFFKSIYLFKNLHIYFGLLGLLAVQAFSLVAASGGYSLVVVHRLLIAVVSLITEHGL